MRPSCKGVGTGGAEGAAAPPTFGTGEQAIALAPPKVIVYNRRQYAYSFTVSIQVEVPAA